MTFAVTGGAPVGGRPTVGIAGRRKAVRRGGDGDLAAEYLQHTGTPTGPRLGEVLEAVRARTEERVAELQALLGRSDRFEAEAADALAGRGDLGAGDPRAAHRTA